MAKLFNLKRQARVFNLEHPTFVNTHGDNGVGKSEVLDMRPREVKEVHPDTLMCREVRAALHPRKGRPTLRVIT